MTNPYRKLDSFSTQDFSNSTIKTISRSMPGMHSQKHQVLDYYLPNFKPSGKPLECLVVLLDGKEEVFIIDSGSLGHHLFNAVLEKLDINERQYFGITFKDKYKNKQWLNYAIKISKQVPGKQMAFEFQVKFYPPEIGMIKEANTIIYLGQQLRQDLCCGKLQCSYYVYKTMASYIIQAEIGNYCDSIHRGSNYIENIPVAPAKIQTSEFMEDLVELHKSQSGLSSVEAYKRFLINSTKCSLYGMDFYYLKDCDGEDVTLGVNYLGVSIFYGYIKKFMFLWCRLIEFGFSKKKLFLIIRDFDINEPNVKHKYKSVNVKYAELAYTSIVNNHFFFIITEFRTQYKTFKYQQEQNLLYKGKIKRSIFLSQRQGKINDSYYDDLNNSTNTLQSSKIKQGGLSALSINYSDFASRIPKCSTLRKLNDSKKDFKLSPLLEEENVKNSLQSYLKRSENQSNFTQNKQDVKPIINPPISHKNQSNNFNLENSSQPVNNVNFSSMSLQSIKAAKLVNKLQKSKINYE